MVVVRDRVGRGQAALRQIAIPLSYRRLRLVGQVQSSNRQPALPSTVCWHGRPAEQGRAMRRVPDPLAADLDCIDVERHGLQLTPGYSSWAISSATRRYSPRAKTSTGFSSFSASIGRLSQTGM